MEESREHIIERLSGDGNLEELKALIGSNHTQLEINVALENAIAYSKIDTAEYLISIGADISNYDFQGVYYAVHNNELEGLKFSIKQGVDVNINSGQLINTAIITLYNTKDSTILKYLLQAGADTKLISQDTLEAFGTDDIKQILREFKTDVRCSIEEKLEFELRLKESVKNLIEFTQSMVSNLLSKNIEFIIEPNQRKLSDHLTSDEQKKLIELNKLKGKRLSFNNVIELLHLSGKVPLWINTEVYHSEKDKTIVRLICSRRFRADEDLNYQADKFPPFHILVPTPPNRVDNVKFDVNWREQNSKKTRGILNWLRK